ncbi:MAG: hypothetical protein HY344_00570 [Candidatus Levybacteria bacterium]|nr:hypothetical protein [Candidatus Levybacteria bacterium]
MGLFEKKDDRNRNKCPYCGAIFEKLPKRKTKCEKCGEECFIRTTQTIFNSDILTQEDALAADFFKELQYLGATVNDYLKIEAELSKKWGTKPKSYDIVWGVSNRLVGHPPEIENDYDKRSSILHHAKMIAFAQALYQLRRGHDPYSYLKSVHNYEIQLGTIGGILPTYFEVETQDCCEECSKYQGKKYTADELKNNPILPIKDCTSRIEQKDYAWCMCWYGIRHS